jgi:hypothetical protein
MEEYKHYVKEAKKGSFEDWKDICAYCSKVGMKWAQKTIEQQLGRLLVYYYFAGIYSDGMSKFITCKEGLKNKTQRCFGKSI